MLKIIKIIIGSIFLSAFCSFAISAQTTNQATEDLQKRVAEMEAQMKQMREEFAKLKQSLPVNQTAAQVSVNANDSTIAAKSETKTETNQNISASAPSVSTAAPNKTAVQPPTKKDLGVDVGSARVTPYGTIYFNAFGNSYSCN